MAENNQAGDMYNPPSNLSHDFEEYYFDVGVAANIVAGPIGAGSACVMEKGQGWGFGWPWTSVRGGLRVFRAWTLRARPLPLMSK